MGIYRINTRALMRHSWVCGGYVIRVHYVLRDFLSQVVCSLLPLVVVQGATTPASTTGWLAEDSNERQDKLPTRPPQWQEKLPVYIVLPTHIAPYQCTVNV